MTIQLCPHNSKKLVCILEKAGDHGTSKDTYDEIMVKKESIKATAPKAKKKRKTTQIWKEFEDSYLMDLNVSEKVVSSR